MVFDNTEISYKLYQHTVQINFIIVSGYFTEPGKGIDNEESELIVYHYFFLGQYHQFKCCKHTVSFWHQRRHGKYLGPHYSNIITPDFMPFRDSM